MKWEPIETAPIDVQVEMGRYGDSWTSPDMEWKTTVGRARVKALWFFWRWTDEGRRYSHWRHLPDPPE